MSQLLDEWAPKGAFDFAEFAAYFPISVMFGLIGASPAAIPSIRKSLETQGLSANLIRSLLPDLEAAYQVLWNFVHNLIVERQRDGGGDEEDVLNTLIAARAAGKLDEGGVAQPDDFPVCGGLRYLEEHAYPHHAHDAEASTALGPVRGGSAILRSGRQGNAAPHQRVEPLPHDDAAI